MAGSLGGCATTKGDLAPRSGRRVVVIGGGWGGATAARYVRLADPTIEVIKQEQRSPGDPSLKAQKALLQGMPDGTPADLAAYYSSLR